MMGRSLIVILALATLGAASWFTLHGPRGELQKATQLAAPIPLPEFALTGQDGQAFGPEQLRGHWSLLFFGFTHCPDVCPATLQQLALARAQLAETGAALPDIVLISVDPERDTPALMAEYTAYFGAGVSGVTGELEELRRLTSALGIYFEKSAEVGDDYDVAHTAAVLVINPRAELQALFGAPHNSGDFVNDLPLLMAAR